MIDWLEIRNFAIADHVDLNFSNGFTTVTGETGSGKSLMVDALGILLGGRSDNAWIKHGFEQAEIQAGFAIPENHVAHEWLKQQELVDNNECLLRRVLRRDKPSRGYINGQAATATQLRELGALLVEIHGQHEYHSLLNRGTQMQLLDAAAGNLELLTTLGNHYDHLSGLKKQLETLNQERTQVQERMDLLTFQLNELQGFNPEKDDWLEIESNRKRLQHQHDIIDTAQKVSNELSDADQSVLDTLNQQIQALGQIEELDSALKSANALIREAEINLQEASAQLRDICSQDDFSEEDFQQIEHRFADYHNLSRKHRTSPELLGDLMMSLEQELETLKDPEKESERLEAEIENAIQAFLKVAKQVSKRRADQAKILTKEVSALIQELGMEGARLEIALDQLDAGSFSRSGLETVRFEVSTNPGQPLQALNKIASGGELSRISLAIQVVLAHSASVSTLVFDEVDIGIGGGVANIVGQKLKHLGHHRQILCVTHLPQVAAKGDDHFRVFKDSKSDISVTVEHLDSEKRIEEIARMTGGTDITAESRAHAEQLIGAA